MRLTWFVIVIVITIMVAGAHRRGRGRGRVRGGRRQGEWRRDGRGLVGWLGRGSGRGWSKRGGRGSNCPSRRHRQPVDGNWGKWCNYDQCSLTCGFGIQKRYRLCNNPAPGYNGRRCIGRNREERYCNRCPCPDPCENVTCLNGGKCQKGKCECTGGYSGLYCDVDSCNKRCLNNAPCNNGICDCLPLFSGEDCGTKFESVDLCENITCLNGGRCVSGICNCTPGYDGEDCSVNLCDKTNCHGEPTPCVPIRAPGGYTCSCIERIRYFTPTISQYDIGLCNARSIITPVKIYDENFNVTTIIPGVPGKNLTISFIDDFELLDPDYVEIGGTQYSGFAAPADITLPPGAGTEVRFVTDDNGFKAGYTFTYQYIDAVPDTNPCKNGGTINTQQTCNCMPGFKGTNCEFPAIITPHINYDANQNTMFTLPGFPERELVLTFIDDFSIETTDGNCNDTLRSDCMRDHVEIEGKRYCGGMAPKPITIPRGNGTTVRFVSYNDLYQCQTGFRLTYVYRDP